jgi:hypothetical protein
MALGLVRRDPCDAVAFPSVKHTGAVTADWLEMISTDTQVMHGQTVIAGTRSSARASIASAMRGSASWRWAGVVDRQLSKAMAALSYARSTSA